MKEICVLFVAISIFSCLNIVQECESKPLLGYLVSAVARASAGASAQSSADTVSSLSGTRTQNQVPNLLNPTQNPSSSYLPSPNEGGLLRLFNPLTGERINFGQHFLASSQPATLPPLFVNLGERNNLV